MFSRHICRWISAALAATVVVAAPLPAHAQKKKSERVNLKGQVVSASPGLFTAKADGKLYTIKFSKERNIVAVTGNLDLDQLQRGMLVRCTGTLKGNAIEGEVPEVKLFGVADGYQLGILQDAPDQPATVSGQLSKLKDRSLTIAAGRKNINVKLAENATVVVDTKDYSMLKGGEQIQFDGPLSSDGKTVSARKITITLGAKADEPKPEAKGKKNR
jgi:hypothetical protein